MFLKKIIIFFSIVFFNNVLCCENINLQTKEKSPLNNIPIYDQDGLGNCYAYAASTLIDYQRLKQNPSLSENNLTHPIWTTMTAVNHSGIFFKDRDFSRGGLIAYTIKDIRKHGICDKTVVREALNQYKNENNITDAELLNFIEEIYINWPKNQSELNTRDIYNKAFEDSYVGAEVYGLRRMIEANPSLRKYFIGENGNLCGRMKNSLHDKLFTLMEDTNGVIRKTTPRLLLNKILNECNKSNHIEIPSIGDAVTSCGGCTDKGMNQKIAALLKSDQPVGISYCAAVLYDQNFQGENASNRGILRKTNALKRDCGHHASVIVGSRKHGDKCQYLLRNSWGNTSYRAFPNCVCKNTSGEYFDCQHGDGRPDKVGCWIDSDSLTPNITGLTHF